MTLTTEQRIMMRLNAMRLRPTIESGRICVKAYLGDEKRETLKEMGFRFDANRQIWYWERKPPQPLHKANRIRSRKYTGELTDPDTTK